MMTLGLEFQKLGFGETFWGSHLSLGFLARRDKRVLQKLARSCQQQRIQWLYRQRIPWLYTGRNKGFSGFARKNKGLNGFTREETKDSVASHGKQQRIRWPYTGRNKGFKGFPREETKDSVALHGKFQRLHLGRLRSSMTPTPRP